MVLSLFATSLRGRKAYKDDTDTLYLECTSCQSIKSGDNFVKQKGGFLEKRSLCNHCKNDINKPYMKQWRKKKALANYS